MTCVNSLIWNSVILAIRLLFYNIPWTSSPLSKLCTSNAYSALFLFQRLLWKWWVYPKGCNQLLFCMCVCVFKSSRLCIRGNCKGVPNGSPTPSTSHLSVFYHISQRGLSNVSWIIYMCSNPCTQGFKDKFVDDTHMMALGRSVWIPAYNTSEITAKHSVIVMTTNLN